MYKRQPLKIVGSCREEEHGTRVTFLPDKEIFEETVYDFDTLKIRLRETAFLTKGLKITLRDDREEKKEKTFHYEGGIREFVEYLNRSNVPLYEQVFYCEGQKDGVLVEVAMQHNDSYTENIYSFVNNINTPEGGTHLTGFKNALTKTFNDYGRKNKMCIRDSISSDRPPREIETLEDRLRSRFEWGLTVDIQQPDYETRMAILRKKEELEGYNIDNEVIKYIASNIKSNIRELEGALTKIVALSKLNNREINIELAEEALKDLISPNAVKEVTPQLILNVVAEHFGINTLDIIGQKRSKELVFPRQIVMYLCGDMTTESLQNIGKALGGRDHTTIIHGTKKIADRLKTDENLQNTVDILKKKINPH